MNKFEYPIYILQNKGCGKKKDYIRMCNKMKKKYLYDVTTNILQWKHINNYARNERNYITSKCVTKTDLKQSIKYGIL